MVTYTLDEFSSPETALDEATRLVADDPAGAANLLVRMWVEGNRWREAVNTSRDAGAIDRLRGDLLIAREGERSARHREREATEEAYRTRLLWSAAAGCLNANRARLAKPRGGDERRILKAAEEVSAPVCDGTDGWLDWLPDDEATTP